MLKLLTSGPLFYRTSTIFGSTGPFTRRAKERGKTKLCANNEGCEDEISANISTLNIILHAKRKVFHVHTWFYHLRTMRKNNSRKLIFVWRRTHFGFSLDSSINNRNFSRLWLCPMKSLRHQYRYSRTHFQLLPTNEKQAVICDNYRNNQYESWDLVGRAL